MTVSQQKAHMRDDAMVTFRQGTDRLDLDKVRDFMAENDLGAIVPFGTANIAYTTNHANNAMIVINNERDMCQRPESVILPTGELVFAGEKFGDPKRRMNVLASTLKEQGLASGRIGVDMDYISTSCYQELRSALPGLEIKDATSLFWAMRSIKSDEEIGYIQAGARAQEAGVEAILKMWRDGVSMDDIRRCYVQAVMTHGAINAFGGVCNRLGALESWQWHDLRDRPQHVIKTNDRWDIDFHPHERYQGYYAGMAMSVYAGNPPSHVRESAEYRWRANDIIVAQVKAGMSQSQVYQACEEAIQRELGPYPWGPWQWFIHGVGLSLHEQPMVGTLGGDYVPFGASNEELHFEDNMVMAVESGFGVEQMWVMRDGRLQRLHTLPRQLICV